MLDPKSNVAVYMEGHIDSDYGKMGMGVVRYLKNPIVGIVDSKFAGKNINEINEIKDKDINQLKIKLANETTSMLHGKKAALNSEQAAKEAFSGHSLGSNLPSIKIKKKDIRVGDIVKIE